MKSISTMWEMSQYQLHQYLKRHQKTVDKLFEKAQKKGWINVAEFNLYCELTDGYRIMEILYEKQEEVHKEKTHALQQRISDLEKRLHLNPENSHKPPSTSKFKKIKNSRVKTGKKIGAQKGHKGVAPDLEENPDDIHRREPQKCRSCGRPLKDVPEYQVDRRQVVDLKDGRKHVTEYQRVSKFCPECGDFTRADLPEEVFLLRAKKTFGPIVKSVALYFTGYQLIPIARTQEILNDLFGVSISQGTLCNFLKDVSSQLKDWEISLKSQLTNSKLLHVDETSLRCEKRNDWVHVISHESLTLLSPHTNRGHEAQETIGILPEYRGHIVRDGFKAYDQYNKCSHSFCNAHILRELKYLHEEEKQKWAKDFADFLKTTLHQMHESVQINVKRLKQSYQRLLKSGFTEAGSPQEAKGRPPDGFKKVWDQGKVVGKVATFKRRKLSRSMNLLSRLRDHFDEVMAFAITGDVPFTNNQAERDLRMLKVKEKISGCFRGRSSMKDFLRLRSFLSTTKKQELPLLESIYLLQVLDV